MRCSARSDYASVRFVLRIKFVITARLRIRLQRIAVETSCLSESVPDDTVAMNINFGIFI